MHKVKKSVENIYEEGDSLEEKKKKDCGTGG